MKKKVATKDWRDLSPQEALDRFRQAAEASTAKATKSRAIARQTLIDDGIYLKSGKLHPNYR